MARNLLSSIRRGLSGTVPYSKWPGIVIGSLFEPTSEGEESLSRTQHQSTRHRVKQPKRSSSPRPGTSPRQREIEIIETGKRYSWGRRGDAYYIWEKRSPGESLGHSAEASARREFRWLEQEARIRRRRRMTRLLIGAGLVCLAVAPAAIVMYADGSSDPSQTAVADAPDRANAPTAGAADAAGSERHINAEGGYAFRAPAGWNVQTSESSTRITSPTGNAVISILVAPDGGIDAVSDVSTGSIASEWSEIRSEAPRPRTVGDLPALSVGGTAVDGSGTPIRFLSIVIDSGTRNHAIWVSVPETFDATSILPSIDEILTSFRSLEAA